MLKKRDCFILFLIHIVVDSIPCFFLSLPCIVDGLNTMAGAAYLNGYHWTSYLAADGYYYKYGQTYFYGLLFFLFKDPTVLYRSMLLINVVCAGVIPVTAYQICIRYLNMRNRVKAMFLSSVIGFMPCLILNNKQTWAETTLMVMPWILMELILKVYHTEEGDWPRQSLYGILISFFSVFAFMAHQRGVVVVIATLLTMLFVRFVSKRQNVLLTPYLIATAVFLTVDHMLENAMKTYVYAVNQGTTNSSLSFLDKELWEKLFSAKGIVTVIRMFYGWLFNVFTGSSGLLCIGLFMVITVFIHFIKKEKIIPSEVLISVFCLLCFCGAFAMGGLFFFEDNFLYYFGGVLRRSDKLIYGRYLESSILLPSFFGLYYLIEKPRAFHRMGIWIVFTSLSVWGFFTVNIAGAMDGVVTWISNLVTINGFCNMKGYEKGFVEIELLSKPLVIMGAAACAVMLLALCLRFHSGLVCGLFLTVFLTCFGWNSYNVLYRMNQYEEDNMKMVKEVIGQAGDVPEEFRVIYLDDELTRSSYQYVWKDYYIVTKRDSNRSSIDNMFMVSFLNEYNKELCQQDYFELRNIEDSSEFYHVYIKGEELNSWLNQHGIATEKLEDERR